MLKHATINRTNRAQQALQLQRHWSQQRPQGHLQAQSADSPLDELDSALSPLSTNNDQFVVTSPLPSVHDLNNNINAFSTPSPQPSIPCSPSSPTSSLLSTPSKVYPHNVNSGLSATSNNSNPSSHLGGSQNNSPKKATASRCSSESMIKIFAQTLSQEVEYVTLHVNSQTKSQQIIKSLLRKFRLKHRDPNLFYLTLERWIRKDGLKIKSVMLLADEACPLQLQQCCSNPPHNDIKFTLQMRAGALVKVFCSDVAPDTRYKCLSLSPHTTVEETIELMLHCLNLVPSNFPKTTQSNNADNNSHHHLQRLSGSPSSTGSSSNSSSSGIESDQPTTTNFKTSTATQMFELTSSHQHSQHIQNYLDSNSRTSSVTSISSTPSNTSNISSNGIAEQYCLVIECKDSNFKRQLEADEYLVDVYQNLIAEAKGRLTDVIASPLSSSNITNDNDTSNTIRKSNSTANTTLQLEQWFFIKLKRRSDYNNDSNQTLKFMNPRQNVPLPPLPLSLPKFNNTIDVNVNNNLQNIVSTTQIEVSRHHLNKHYSHLKTVAMNGFNADNKQQSTLERVNEAAVRSPSRPLPPPPAIITLPPIRPRRRNLSTASSTFGRPQQANNRRRYDPAQLAEDLDKLDVKEADPVAAMNNNDDDNKTSLNGQDEQSCSSLNVRAQVAESISINSSTN